MAYFGGEKYVLFYFLLLPINRWKLRAYCDDKVKKKTKQTILQSNNWKKKKQHLVTLEDKWLFCKSVTCFFLINGNDSK